MHDPIAEILGVDPESDGARLAVAQVEHDSQMLDKLIALRQAQHQNVEDFAESIGVTLEELLDFEHDPLNFDLNFIRIYAHSVGAEIRHCLLTKEDRVTPDPKSSKT